MQMECFQCLIPILFLFLVQQLECVFVEIILVHNTERRVFNFQDSVFTEKLNFKDTVIILKFSGLQLLSGFEMFTMFYGWYSVAVMLFKSYPQCLFPITLPLQMDIILSRNYPPTKPVTQDAFRSYPVEFIICACTARAQVLLEHFFTYFYEIQRLILSILHWCHYFGALHQVSVISRCKLASIVVWMVRIKNSRGPEICKFVNFILIA